MRKIFFGLAWVIGPFIATAILAVINPLAAVLLAGAFCALALVAYFRPIPTFHLDNKLVSAATVLSAVVSMAGAVGVHDQAGKKAEQTLRATDPSRYLAGIRGKVSDEVYFSELKILDPSGHAIELERRAEAERAETERLRIARDKEREELRQQIAAHGPKIIVDEIKLRQRYAELVPSDTVNITALSKLQARQREIDAQEEAERQQRELIKRVRNAPQDFLTLVDFSWRKGGFGTVMEASFKVKNDSPLDIKDITFQCEHSGASGTRIDANTRTIYDVIKGKSTRIFRNFNMGFVHTQAAQSSCRIVSAKAI